MPTVPDAAQRMLLVAKAALSEAGRPDLAAEVSTDGNGNPAILHGWFVPNRDVILRAFTLAHESVGQQVTVYYESSPSHHGPYISWSTPEETLR